MAAAATGGLALLVLEETPAPVAQGGREADPATASPGVLASPRADTLRPYETTLTLAEDLRDALPGPASRLSAELWRVSASLKSKARWTLQNLARQEASPRVRALLVLAAGVHVPDDGYLLRFLDDRATVVRTAAVLACGHRANGSVRHALWGGLEVPVGRSLAAETRRTVEAHQTREADEGVRAAVAAVLGVSSPR
jgi:hypothetical protein